MTAAEKRARRRQQWFAHYEQNGRNARLTCRFFGISPTTFYLWKRRYRSEEPGSLLEKSRRPHRVRQPLWSDGLVAAVFRLRRSHAGMGKVGLTALLRQEGFAVSNSTTGRVLRLLQRSERLSRRERRPLAPSRQRFLRQLPGQPAAISSRRFRMAMFPSPATSGPASAAKPT